MVYRGIEYRKIKGYWRARPGQGTGERSARPTRKTKREPKEPRVFWECVDERNGHHCSTRHRSRRAAHKHAIQLDRRAGRGSRRADGWEPFKVVDGVGYHYGVGAPT